MGRPLGITILALLAFLIGLIEILRSLFGFMISLTAFPVGLHFPTGIVVPLYLVMGLVWIFIAITFWKGAEIGWYLGLLMTAFVIVLDFPAGSVLGTLVLLYLVIPKGVRNWFSKGSLRNLAVI
jgi:hypothetical protein